MLAVNKVRFANGLRKTAGMNLLPDDSRDEEDGRRRIGLSRDRKVVAVVDEFAAGFASPN